MGTWITPSHSFLVLARAPTSPFLSAEAPAPACPTLASQGDNLTSSGSECRGQAFKAVIGETMAPLLLLLLPQCPFMQKQASGHETEDGCGTAMPFKCRQLVAK